MALKGEVDFIPRISNRWYLILITYIWIRTYKIIFIRLRAEWECMQMEFMTSSIKWPFSVKLLSLAWQPHQWHHFLQGHAKQLLQAKNVFPKSEVVLKMVLFPQFWCRCIFWLGVAMTSWLIPRRWSGVSKSRYFSISILTKNSQF